MAPFDLGDGWQARCRQWVSLLREDEAAAPLRALLQDMEKHMERGAELVAEGKAVRHYRATLRAELDKLRGRVRAEMFFAKQSLRPMMFSAEDLREESRLCREECSATDDMEIGRAIAAHGVDFAILGGAVESSPVASDSWVTQENIRRFGDRLKHERDPKRRSVLEGLLAEQEAKLPPDSHHKVWQWRMKAEELRAAADQMTDPTARGSLRRTASTYDRLAADAEARVTGGQPRSDKDAG